MSKSAAPFVRKNRPNLNRVSMSAEVEAAIARLRAVHTAAQRELARQGVVGPLPYSSQAQRSR